MEIDRLTDDKLILRTLEGCDSSFEVLFDRYRDMLYTSVSLRTGDSELCNDIVQEAFIKAYFNLEKFNSFYNFGGWIVTIAKNLLIDYNRRAENQMKESTEEIDVVSREPNPEESFMRIEDNLRIRRAIEGLSPMYQRIIELRFWRDMSYEQICVELELPMGTVKTQVYRARRAFIDILG